jgi:hypothetical protein
MKNHFVSTLVALIALASVSNAAMACREGETKFVNDVQYTCICNTLSTGNQACSWRAD